MKYLIIALFFIELNIANAQSVMIAKTKASALKACEEKAAYSPEKLREEMLSTCRCVVEHTNFDKAAQLKESKDDVKLQTFYQNVDEACWTTEKTASLN